MEHARFLKLDGRYPMEACRVPKSQEYSFAVERIDRDARIHGLRAVMQTDTRCGWHAMVQ